MAYFLESEVAFFSQHIDIFLKETQNVPLLVKFKLENFLLTISKYSLNKTIF